MIIKKCNGKRIKDCGQCDYLGTEVWGGGISCQKRNDIEVNLNFHISPNCPLPDWKKTLRIREVIVMTKQGILLKDTDFIKDMRKSVNYIERNVKYLKVMDKATYKIVTLKAAINYMQSEINYYKKYIK